MVDHIANRKQMVRALCEELVGPAPTGEELDCSQGVTFGEATESYKRWRQKGSGEEILQRDPPTRRYGIGVLYPFATMAGDTASDAGLAATGQTVVEEPDAALAPGQDREVLAEAERQKMEKARENLPDDAGSDEFDMAANNTFRPSSMGISFLASLPPGANMVVDASCGRYDRLEVQVEGKNRQWWLRRPVAIVEEFSGDGLCSPSSRKVKGTQGRAENKEGLDLRIEVFSRPYAGIRGQRLLTVCLVNRTLAREPFDEACVFQAFFKVRVESSAGDAAILPYPSQRASAPGQDTGEFGEEESLALLYRQEETFATGHGCAAGWEREVQSNRVRELTAESLPSFEVASITPEIRREDGSQLEVPMATLAGIIPGAAGDGALSEVIERYAAWIAKKRIEMTQLESRHHRAAARHLDECERCLARMKAGLAYLQGNPQARRAFELANHAVLLQQIHTRSRSRAIKYDEKARRWAFTEPYPDLDPTQPVPRRGKWRPFQVAFLLMAVRSAVEGDAADRQTVELIWFPTGGGKTEAYLGLAAFALFMRRLRGTGDCGVHVLMRYTLRLLSTQQFQRASGLACAMEHVRKQYVSELGETPFSIGIWVGGANTPNTRQDAVQALGALEREHSREDNPFVLGRCPWCGAEMGPPRPSEDRGKAPPARAVGYHRQGNTVVYQCPDNRCEFRDSIPVYVIDEDIYEFRPSIVIGTVDKFAMLAWRPEARALFGLDMDGKRFCSPPGLIIQDELHLIAGPLGSMVGLYEPAIEELCTDRRGGEPVAPKIVSSTATIRRYAAQIRALYGRNDVALFPPPGLEASDSFFASYARDGAGRLQPGRMYVGVHAPGLGSMQTVQVRVFTVLLQAAAQLPSPEERDPWWTLLVFFNSLRELGTTLSLFQSDIPDYLKVLGNRLGLGFAQFRHLDAPLELTGRISSAEVPQAIERLETSCASSGDPEDVCLASNILEVGIDIDRLSLMSVVGQPKTTSQYIQVTGRVGRLWWEKPGLVVTLYGAAKPRDRSHFEKFRSYHERLYAQVEPTSLTPFSPPAIVRGLHAVMAAYARQAGNRELANSPYPYPATVVAFLNSILMARVQAVDPEEAQRFQAVFDQRAGEWKRWERTKWGSFGAPGADTPLLRPSGAYADEEARALSWPTPTSMRTVDAECEAQITQLYIRDEEPPNA